MTKFEMELIIDALSAENLKLKAENSALRVQLDALRDSLLSTQQHCDACAAHNLSV